MSKSVNVRLTPGSDQLTKLLQRRNLEQVESLSVQGLTDEGASLLAASPRLAGLHQLCLPNGGIGDEGVATLAASPHLGNLRSLDLLQNRVGDAGVIQLAN